MAEVLLPSSPADLDVIRGVLDDVVTLMEKKKLADEDIKDHLESLAEKFDVPTSFLKKMATVRFKQNYENMTKDVETFEQAFETLFPNERTG